MVLPILFHTNANTCNVAFCLFTDRASLCSPRWLGLEPSDPCLLSAGKLGVCYYSWSEMDWSNVELPFSSL